MVETHVSQLAGERIRYNDDTWEFTGDIEITQNGSVIEATARKSDRVRKNLGTFRFQLQDPPGSINPGNVGEFGVKLEREGRDVLLVITRRRESDRYSIKSLHYN